MLHLPPLTFWLIIPWPFIWLTISIVMYMVHKRQDDLEERYKAK